MGQQITDLFSEFSRRNGTMPKLYMESGRFMTGPHGALVTTATNRKEIYRTYVGVDASMSALMRPGMYNAYHHITVLGKEDQPLGSLQQAHELKERYQRLSRRLERTLHGLPRIS